MAIEEEGNEVLRNLQVRRSIALQAIRVLADEKVDPRARPAEGYYREQLAKLDAMIAKITGTPPPVTVGLKTAVLFAQKQ